MTEMPRVMDPAIYCYITDKWVSGGVSVDVVVIALSEDGHVLGHHVSSTVEWAQGDIGYTDAPMGASKRRAFAEHYPDGYRLEWVDEPATHEGIAAAVVLNRALFPDGDEREGNK